MNAGIMSFARLALLLLVSGIMACTSDVEPLTPAQREAVAAYVSKVAPSPQHSLDLDFDGKVRLLGYDIDRAQWRPGETMRVTWYWHVLERVDEGWKLFTHIDDADHERTLNQDGNGTLRWLYAPDRWSPGTYIRDSQELHLPEDWLGTAARLYVGLWREGQRLRVSGGVSDKKGRMLALTVPTPELPDVGRSQHRVPKLGVVQTKRPPRLDGSLGDPVWSFANTTHVFVETVQGGVAPLQASAKLLWDKRYLYVAVDVKDGLLRASHTERDDHLWEQDCVELMIDPTGDGKNYFEIQVSPRGVVFDTRYDSPRFPAPFGHTDWDSNVRVGVSPRGNIDDKEADAGYIVEMAIPWQAFSLDGKRVSPPAIGDEWRANLYVMDLIADRQQAAAWSPLETGDFHVPRRFGILAFEGPPEAMMGTNEPLQIPLEISADRMPKPMGRRPALDRGAKDTMIRKRVINRQHPGEPAPRSVDAKTVDSPDSRR
ncbi:MAG: carbohydrate-binding family 9-like protein [Deltaproteobacteria bacterium]|nr:carbohydrate-binding family 9-like protein [Deltaproteobacteria bacterium]